MSDQPAVPRHDAAPGHQAAPKVVIAGGSGALGRRLADHLAQRGFETVILTRQPRPSSHRQVQWDGAHVAEWARELEGDQPVTVINLAGRLVDCRPTPTNIAELRDSRVNATNALVEASRMLTRPVANWIQGSTTAIWSDAGDARLHEHSPLPDPGLPQMTGVAQPWEAAAAAANTDRMTILRTSIVLDRNTPALDTLLRLARLGLGGTVGTGRQWFSWIHIADWLSVVDACLELQPGIEIPDGVLIAASDHPVRNAELMSELRRTVGRSFGIPSPAAVVRLGAFAMRSDPLLGLTGRHCTSTVLRDAGFRFQYPLLRDALADIVQ